MSNRTFGYARVSSKDQNEARQSKTFKDYGIDDRDIYIDKKSGKDFEREQYQLLKNILREDYLLVIQSIDRLGRNYEMIVNEWKDITKNIKADIVVLDMPLLDTRQKKDLLGTFINDLILGLLSYVA
jgi:recombinase